MNLSSYIESDFCVQHMVNVLYRHYAADWHFDHSWRPHCALYYIKDGVLGIRSGDREYRIRPNSIALLDRGINMYAYCSEVGSSGTLDVYMISFYSGTLFSDVGLPPVLCGQNSYLPQFEEAHTCWTGQPVAYRIRTRAMLENIIASLIADAAAAEGMHASSGKLEKLLAYIHTHYKEQITTEDMCRVANYSPSHIRRIFSSEFGMPPLKYVNKVRIRRACELLSDDNTPVCRIAEAVGFDNAPYFSRTFREIMHMTPGEYRRTAANQNVRAQNPDGEADNR